MKNKLIIVEGCNNSGKTTLYNYIIKTYPQLNFKYIKCSQPKKSPFEEYSEILDKIENNVDNYFIDRFHLGEKVYSYIYRNGPEMTENQFKLIESRILKLKNYDYLLVFCKTDINILKSNNLKNKEEYIKNKDVEKELNLFNKAFYESNLDYQIHDIINKNIIDMKIIDKFINN
jgi:hypothetical protein